jgi:protein SCO1/2
MPRALKVSLALLVGFVVLAGGLYASLFQLDVRPRLGFAPGFSLTAADGSGLTSDDLRGSITVFTFDHAGNDDPVRGTTPVLRAVQTALDAEDTGGIPIRLVTVAFDGPPPERLRAATAAADADAWTWTTGSPDALRRTVRDGFGAYYEQDSNGTYRFDPTFVVVDGLGIIRARYRLGLPRPEALVSDVRSLVREAQSAEGTLGLAYEAAHLFSCYSVASP